MIKIKKILNMVKKACIGTLVLILAEVLFILACFLLIYKTNYYLFIVSGILLCAAILTMGYLLGNFIIKGGITMPEGVAECVDLIDNEISNQRNKEDPYKTSNKDNKEEKYREGYLNGLEKANEILNDYIENHQE